MKKCLTSFAGAAARTLVRPEDSKARATCLLKSFCDCVGTCANAFFHLRRNEVNLSFRSDREEVDTCVAISCNPDHQYLRAACCGLEVLLPGPFKTSTLANFFIYAIVHGPNGLVWQFPSPLQPPEVDLQWRRPEEPRISSSSSCA
eukprot:scaffold1307_cov200-Pinguiococcus_pyrenoidosus.AAC.78